MKHLLAVAAIALASFTAGSATPASAFLSNCFTHGYMPDAQGRYVAAYSQCGGDAQQYEYIQTRIRCSNGVTVAGNRIGPNSRDANNYPYQSKALCPFATYALSWYFAYWY